MAFALANVAVTLLFVVVLLSGSAVQGISQPSVREIVKNRLIAGFKEGCNPQETSLHSLQQAVRTAYVDLQRREGKKTEVSSA